MACELCVVACGESMTRSVWLQGSCRQDRRQGTGAAETSGHLSQELPSSETHVLPTVLEDSAGAHDHDVVDCGSVPGVDLRGFRQPVAMYMYMRVIFFFDL